MAFGAVKQRKGPVSRATRLIHIIPDKYVISTESPMPFLVFAIMFKQGNPPIPAAWVKEIHPRAAAAPTPTFKFAFTARRLD
jgi:hypothetical protein